MPLERYRGAPLASWEHRAVADLIDLGIPAVAVGILALLYGLVHLALRVSIGSTFALIVIFLIFAGFLGWSWGWVQGHTGRSLGKQMMNLRLVRADNGRAPSFALNAKRESLHLLVDCILTLGLGGLVPLFTKKRQTLADYPMQTLVVYDSRRFLPARASSFRKRRRRPPPEEMRDEFDEDLEPVLDVDSWCEELPSPGGKSAAV